MVEAEVGESPQKLCLYDVLEVEQTVDADALRIAYRKQAMKWHPDKIQQSGASPDACERATVLFQQINRAYEVLSDPAQRASYDQLLLTSLHWKRQISPRTSRPRPPPPRAPNSRSWPSPLQAASPRSVLPGEFELDLKPYFGKAAFSGFGETGSGFYAVYGELFKRIHAQEQVFARKYGNGVAVKDAPELGGRDAPSFLIHLFNHHWQGFSTVKDFRWCDKSKHPHTRTSMERKNRDMRDWTRFEFDATVRELASLVFNIALNRQALNEHNV